MATGSGKTTVMGMLAAWSILNKVNDRGDARFSDVVLVVCPNVTIRDRLRELDPEGGEASLYRTRDLVPPHLMNAPDPGPGARDQLARLRAAGSANGRRERQGEQGRRRRCGRRETITIGGKTTTARGTRYLTQTTLDAAGRRGHARRARGGPRRRRATSRRSRASRSRYVESDTALVNRVLGREVGGKQNILVMNDEAHHAYRIKREEPDDEERGRSVRRGGGGRGVLQGGDGLDRGLDRIHKLRGHQLLRGPLGDAVLPRAGRPGDQPALPVGRERLRPDRRHRVRAGEDPAARRPRHDRARTIPGYFNIWHWILPKLTPAERGGKRANPKPEAILKWAHTPIAMLGGLWEDDCEEWDEGTASPARRCSSSSARTPRSPRSSTSGSPRTRPRPASRPSKIDGFRNRDGAVNTIRVDSKVVHETDTGEAKSDETRWMRLTLDTVGKTDWPRDRQGRPLYPEGFEELAKKLERPLHPPGPRRALHRQRRHADRGLGLQHGHAHRRPAAVHVAAAVRAGGRPRPAAGELRGRTRTACSPRRSPRSSACRSR